MTDIPLSNARKFLRIILPCLGKIRQSCFISLSVDEVWAFLNPKASSAKKTSSQWSVFGAQRSLGSRVALPGVIVSRRHRILRWIKGHFLQLFKEAEDYTIYTKYNLSVTRRPD